MNTKTSWWLLLLVVVAVLFVPLVPSDSSIECAGDVSERCDERVAYVSLYTKFVKK
jgi:hypothetical protein